MAMTVGLCHFIVPQNGNIGYAYVNADYTQRAEPEDVLAHL